MIGWSVPVNLREDKRIPPAKKGRIRKSLDSEWFLFSIAAYPAEWSQISDCVTTPRHGRTDTLELAIEKCRNIESSCCMCRCCPTDSWGFARQP